MATTEQDSSTPSYFREAALRDPADALPPARVHAVPMATASHQTAEVLPRTESWADRVLVREMWAALAIASMWVAVLFDAIFGPDFVSTSAGGNMTRIPSAIVVALFAYLATRVVARYGFRSSRGDDE
jgi:hypothetical protein